MKNFRLCPKCQSNDIVRIEGHVGHYGDGNNIPVKMFVLSLDRVKVTRFLCLNCGFSEEWIESREDLERIRSKFK